MNRYPFFKVMRYMYLLTWGHWSEFDAKIGGETNSAVRLLFLFKRNLMSNKFRACADCFFQANDQNCLHTEMVDSFVNIILPTLIKEEDYAQIEEWTKKTLQISKITKQNRLALYHILGNTLDHQRKAQELSELIDYIEFQEKETNHPLVKWYRESQKNGEFS